jgi:hypothetical protein
MKPSGCNNTERKPGYYVTELVYAEDGTFTYQQRYIRDTSTTECQYRKDTPNDPQCEGCKK